MTLVENHLLHVLPNLRGHIKTIHEGSKRLQMWLLWKSFAGATSHGIHIKTYKDFKCEYCGKSFAQDGNLRV